MKSVKLIGGVVAVAAVLVAVLTAASAADVQNLTTAEMNSFIGGCGQPEQPCKSPYGEYCQACIDIPWPQGSKKYNMGPRATYCKQFAAFAPSDCTMTGLLTCGTSGGGGKWIYYSQNSCTGSIVNEVSATYEIPTAVGDICH